MNTVATNLLWQPLTRTGKQCLYHSAGTKGMLREAPQAGGLWHLESNESNLGGGFRAPQLIADSGVWAQMAQAP